MVSGKEVGGLSDFYRKVWAVGNAGVDVPLAVLRGSKIRDIEVHSQDRYLYSFPKPQKGLQI